MGGGIPLPALDVHTPQAPDPMEAMGRLVQMKGLINQQAIQQQQMQAGSLENQQREMDVKDQQNMRSLAPNFLKKDDSGKAIGFDADGYYGALMGAGVSPQKIAAMQKAQNDAVMSKAQAGSAALDLEDKRNDQAYQVLESVRSAAKDPKATPESVQSTYQGALPRLQQLGVDVSKYPPQYPGDAGVSSFEVGLGVYKQIIADAKTQAESAKDTAQTGEARANQAKSEAESAWYAKNGGAPGVPIEAQQQADWLSKNPGKTPADFLKYKSTMVPAFNFNMQNGAAAADSNGNPSQIAQALANKQMKWSEAVSPRTPQSVKNAIMAQVFKLNPNYDTSEFGLEADAAKKARSGAWADTRVAYNTAIDHANQLLAASDALNNGDIRKISQLKNYFKTEFGSPDVSNFSAIANAYNHEVTSVVSKGHITDAEVAQGHGVLPDNASPQQIRGVAEAYKNLMTSKRDELDKVIKAGAGSKANGVLGVGAGGPSATSGGAFDWNSMPQHQ